MHEDLSAFVDNARTVPRHGQLSDGNSRLDEPPVRLVDASRFEALIREGTSLHRAGRPQEAVGALEKASQIAPLTDQARVRLASCYAQLQLIDRARELYLRLALSRRLSADLMLQIADGLASIDAPQLAMQVCEWVTERDDSIAKAFYDMGRYSAACGKPLYLTEALMQRALQLEPDNRRFRIGLASWLVQMRQDGEALDRLASIAPGDLSAVQCSHQLEHLADLFRRHGMASFAEACQRRQDELQASLGGRAFADASAGSPAEGN
jgi:thioredoxin-like negative regulator of GroEL